MRATYFVVLMILYTMANIFAAWFGIDEMTQLTNLIGLISIIVLSVYYILMVLYYMKRKHTRGVRRWRLMAKLGNGRPR